MEIKIGFGLLLRDVEFFDSTRQADVFRLTKTWKLSHSIFEVETYPASRAGSTSPWIHP